MVKKLSLKQKHFVHEYLANGGNATKAVLKAYDTDNYNAARVIGSHNLTKVNIAEYIDQLLETRDGLTLDNALESLSRCVNTKPKGEGSHSDKLAATKLLLRLHKAIPGTQPTTTTTTKLTISAQAIADRVAAQEVDITPETPYLDPKSD